MPNVRVGLRLSALGLVLAAVASACGSGGSSGSKAEKAREKYEPAVLTAAQDYALKASAAAMDGLGKLDPNSTLQDAQAKSREVSASLSPEGQASGSAICDAIESGRKTAHLGKVDSDEELFADRAVTHSIRGSIAQEFLRGFLRSDATLRDHLLAVTMIGSGSDSSSRYAQAVSSGIIGSDGSVPAPPKTASGYDSLVDWLDRTPDFAGLVGIFSRESLKATGRCITDPLAGSG